jgi:AcrR family transcriptional regulator
MVSGEWRVAIRDWPFAIRPFPCSVEWQRHWTDVAPSRYQHCVAPPIDGPRPMRKTRPPVSRPPSGGPRKPRGMGYERREEILAAATELFLSHGYENVTTRQLAARVGLSQTGLYVYFKNKEEILEALRRATFGRLGKCLEDAVGEGARGPALLRRVLTRYIEFALENADAYQLTFMVTHASLKEHARKDLARPLDEQPPGLQVFLAFREQVSRLIDAGVLKKADATVVTQALWSAAHGLATLLISHPAFPWVDHRQLIDTLVETLVQGLRRPQR